MEILVLPPPEHDPEFMFPCAMCGYLSHKLVINHGAEWFTCNDCSVLLAGTTSFREPLINWNLPASWHVVE